jgi:hypothetical protein
MEASVTPIVPSSEGTFRVATLDSTTNYRWIEGKQKYEAATDGFTDEPTF